MSQNVAKLLSTKALTRPIQYVNLLNKIYANDMDDLNLELQKPSVYINLPAQLNGNGKLDDTRVMSSYQVIANNIKKEDEEFISEILFNKNLNKWAGLLFLHSCPSANSKLYNSLLGNAVYQRLPASSDLKLFCEIVSEEVKNDQICMEKILLLSKPFKDVIYESFTKLQAASNFKNIRFINIILSVAVRENDSDKITEYLNICEKESIPLDTGTFNLLIKFHANNGNIHKIEECRKEMEVKNIKEDSYTYRALFRAHKKDPLMLDKLVAEARAKKVKLDSVMLNALVEIYSDLNDCETVGDYCAYMEAEGIKLSSNALAAMVKCIGKKSIARMETLLLHAMDNRVKITVDTVNSMMKVYEATGLLEKVEKTFSMLNNMKIAPNAESYEIMIRVLDRAGMKTQKAWYERLKSKLAF
jgi:pentatricopeptide repeat protein